MASCESTLIHHNGSNLFNGNDDVESIVSCPPSLGVDSFSTCSSLAPLPRKSSNRNNKKFSRLVRYNKQTNRRINELMSFIDKRRLLLMKNVQDEDDDVHCVNHFAKTFIHKNPFLWIALCCVLALTIASQYKDLVAFLDEDNKMSPPQRRSNNQAPRRTQQEGGDSVSFMRGPQKISTSLVDALFADQEEDEANNHGLSFGGILSASGVTSMHHPPTNMKHRHIQATTTSVEPHADLSGVVMSLLHDEENKKKDDEKATDGGSSLLKEQEQAKKTDGTALTQEKDEQKKQEEGDEQNRKQDVALTNSQEQTDENNNRATASGPTNQDSSTAQP